MAPNNQTDTTYLTESQYGALSDGYDTCYPADSSDTRIIVIGHSHYNEPPYSKLARLAEITGYTISESASTLAQIAHTSLTPTISLEEIVKRFDYIRYRYDWDNNRENITEGIKAAAYNHGRNTGRNQRSIFKRSHKERYRFDKGMRRVEFGRKGRI